MRDIAIVTQLQKMTDVEIDWLAPDPAGEFLTNKGYRVLECSAQLAGSGKAYSEVFARCTDEFNLMDYIRAETRLHMHDFTLSAQCWRSSTYDVIVGDEAFWLLTGFSSHPSAKPAPFIFLTDFIGTRAMRPRLRDLLTAWYSNCRFTLSFRGPDVYIYIGSVGEIPAERFGFLLPRRRGWAQRHCRFVKPIVNFDPESLPDKKTLRGQLGLAGDKVFLAVVGPEGDHAHRLAQLEKVFELLRADFPGAQFILVSPANGTRQWIEYHRYLDNLHEYFAASDFALIQSGYGKVAELASLGIPFIAIPLDYHFEQEYVMAHRLKHFGVGKLMTLRDHPPGVIAQGVREAIGKRVQRVPVDTGSEVGSIILETYRKGAKAG
jgi:hypothetical protein